MPNQIFLDFIGLRREARNLEYKQSTSWSDKTFQAKITKSILAMSNIRDGGQIIIGMKRQADESYVAEGMEQSHLDSMTADTVQSIVAQFADPYVQITLTKEEDDRFLGMGELRVEKAHKRRERFVAIFASHGSPSGTTPINRGEPWEGMQKRGSFGHPFGHDLPVLARSRPGEATDEPADPMLPQPPVLYQRAAGARTHARA
jgi:hypothetical protein